MDLTTAIENFGLLFARLNNAVFIQVVNFFNPSANGILKYWPFFFAAMFFVIFTLVKGLLSIFNDL